MFVVCLPRDWIEWTESVIYMFAIMTSVGCYNNTSILSEYVSIYDNCIMSWLLMYWIKSQTTTTIRCPYMECWYLIVLGFRICGWELFHLFLIFNLKSFNILRPIDVVAWLLGPRDECDVSTAYGWIWVVGQNSSESLIKCPQVKAYQCILNLYPVNHGFCCHHAMYVLDLIMPCFGLCVCIDDCWCVRWWLLCSSDFIRTTTWTHRSVYRKTISKLFLMFLPRNVQLHRLYSV